MYPENNNDRRMQPDITNGNPRNMQYGETSVNRAGRYIGGAFYGEASQNEPAYNPDFYSRSVNNEPPFYKEPVYNEPQYTGQPYNEPPYNEPPFTKPHDVSLNMYSPGICVDQPYPRPRSNENGRNGASRDSGKGLAGFLRGMALVLACTFFSGSAAYIVMDRRFERGDFEIQPPNQVILGGTVPERRSDENAADTVATVYDSMTAEDIYEMARTQVVGINTDVPNMFGFPFSSDSGSTTPISGSGFIISTDGYILTNYHVIEIAYDDNLPINVVLNDGKTYEAEVIGFDVSNDVAVIKINAQGLSPSIIGNSDNVRVGETVYAVGNPFGDLVYTMTDGIVSALDRVVSVEGKSIRTFQFSAAVNSGNSGGPIYNAAGEVIGIVTAKIVRGSVEGIGFAIPINDAVEIASELIEHGYISGRAFMGITGQTVSEANADYFGWVIGVYVRSVSQDSAADVAGIEIGDIITKLNGEDIESMQDLRFALRDHRAGDTTTITIWRSGESIDLPITFDEDMYAGQPDEVRPRTEPESPNPFENRP